MLGLKFNHVSIEHHWSAQVRSVRYDLNKNKMFDSYKPNDNF